MANRGMTISGPHLSSPVWLADFASRDHLIPAGGRMDPAAITADSAGKKFLPSGTLVGRTFAERDAKTPYGLWASGDDEAYLVAFDVPDLNRVDEIELVRHNAVVKENYLPGWAGLAAGVKAQIRATYRCILGVD